jgi:hypothetical protein
MVSLSCFQALILEDPTVLKLGKTFCDQIIAYDLVPFNTECLGMSLAGKSYHYLDSISWGLRNRKELQNGLSSFWDQSIIYILYNDTIKYMT